jgi:phosphopentomutase
MKLCAQQLLALITALSVFTYVLPQRAAAAESHVVSLSELQQDLTASRQIRAENLQDIERVLSLPEAQDGLAKFHLSTERVTAAVAELDDTELAHLADRARAAEQDVQGGFLVGILALIGLIVVIVIVLTVVRNND